MTWFANLTWFEFSEVSEARWIPVSYYMVCATLNGIFLQDTPLKRSLYTEENSTCKFVPLVSISLDFFSSVSPIIIEWNPHRLRNWISLSFTIHLPFYNIFFRLSIHKNVLEEMHSLVANGVIKKKKFLHFRRESIYKIVLLPRKSISLVLFHNSNGVLHDGSMVDLKSCAGWGVTEDQKWNHNMTFM